MTPDEAISAWLKDFAREFLQNRARDIRKRDLLNTQELLNSLDAKVNSQPQKGLHLMVFMARNYGRLQDMQRRYNRVGGSEMVEILKDWAEKEGIGKFTKKNYKDFPTIYRGQPNERILNRIAWGIIRKYKDKGTATKRSWYNKGKERDVNYYYDLLIRIWGEAVALERKDSFIQK